MESSKIHQSLPRIFEATWKAAGVDALAITKLHPGLMATAFKHTGMYIARQHGYSYNEIAKAYGLKGHHTVMYAVQRVAERKADPIVIEASRAIWKELYGE